MRSLHGNLDRMRENLFRGELYNMLPHSGMRLDGHYTILFTVPDFTLYVYQHGGYAGLTTYDEKEFTGFIELNDAEKEYLTSKCKYTYECKGTLWESGRYASESFFDYYYDLFGVPPYMPLLDKILAGGQ